MMMSPTSTLSSSSQIGNVLTWGNADHGKLGHSNSKKLAVPQVSCSLFIVVVLLIVLGVATDESNSPSFSACATAGWTEGR